MIHLIDQLRCNTEADDPQCVFRSTSSPTLLMPTRMQGRQLKTFSDLQRTHALRTVNLVCAHGDKVRIWGMEPLPKTLNCVAVKQCPCSTGEFRQVVDIPKERPFHCSPP